MKKLLFIAALFVLKQVNAQNCFTTRTLISTGAYNPTSVTSADFNHDGKFDIAAASPSGTGSGANGISILLSNGTGSFGVVTTMGAGTETSFIINADLNGDGNADLITVGTSLPPYDISVFLGDGAGGFGVANHFAAGTKPRALLSDDFNADGKADLVGVNNTTNSISVLLGTTGTGNFGTATSYSAGTNPQSVTSGDFSGDGILDLAVANLGSKDISILLGVGDGTFGAATSFTLTSSPNAIISGDFNGDNIKDVATANADTTVSLLLCNGAGSFGAASYFSLGTEPVSLVSSDLNGDGFLDIATANPNAASGSLLLGTGTGSFGTALGIGAATNARSITNGDFNGDNKPDLAIANEGSTNISVDLNSPFVTVSGTATICLGDITTLVAVGAKGGAHRYTWLPTTGLTIAGNDTTAVASPTATTVYTVTGTSNTGCKGVATVTVTVATPTITVNSPTICAGNTATLTAGGANTYTWSTNETSASIVQSPTNTANYTVTGKNTHNCTSTVTTTITVNQLPAITVNSPTVCLGTAATLTASGSAATYTWNTGASTPTLSVTPTIPTSYTVTGTDVNHCESIAIAYVYLNPLPAVTVNSPTICLGNHTILTALGANTYTWSTTATTSTISVTPAVAATYTVTGTDINTCTNVAISTITGYANVAPSICMVTTNATFANNIISWNKTLYPNADSFVVYRYDISSSGYSAIGKVSKDSSQFTDVKRTIGGPNGGNPSLSSWRYKLAVKDTCGNVSLMSPYHETMYIQQINQSIIWSGYNVEAGQSNPVTGYQVLRDSLGNGNWHVLVNTLGTSTNDLTYASYPNAIYRVDALGFNCTPNVKSHSNITKPETSGINQFLVSNNISVYPNPSEGNFVIETSVSSKQLMHISDLNGNIVLSQNIEGATTINASNLNAGIYNISIIGNKTVTNKKLVIVK